MKENSKCFEHAIRFLLDETKEDDGCYLIHGSVMSDAEGRRIKHAWVELPNGDIYEPQTKRTFSQHVFQLCEPIADNRYTRQEALVTLIRSKNYGPWEEHERSWMKGKEEE